MGNQISIETFDPAHVRIYKNILQINNPQTRASMIQTCLAGIEYVQSAKRAGMYSYLLAYVSSVQQGSKPMQLPGENISYSEGPQQHTVPRAFQSVQMQNTVHYPPQAQLTTYKEKEVSPWTQITQTPKQKMVSYFASCLEVLGIQEEVTLTEETLKKAYKKVAIKAHPDKGGSEEHFEAITRAYAYLSEILRRIKGGREKEGVVEAPQILNEGRKEEAKAWQYVEPVRLNPKNLDMNAFNRMFEQTHIPDPDKDGYGDWLKSSKDEETGPKFSGKFNRNVFNSMFDERAREMAKDSHQTNNALTVHPDAMALLPTMGVEIGRDRPETYTAAPNSKQQYTDLRAAYTTDSTFSGKVANVAVEDRKFDTYRAQREKAPAPLSNREMEMLNSSEMEIKRREELRQRRKAERDIMENSYFERMKQLVITRE